MLSRNQYSRIGQDEEANLSKPLFGESRPQERIIHWVLGFLTCLFVGVTLVSAFIFPKWPPTPINLYFGMCIILTCISNIILMFWYRKGDIDPKFRSLIYYNAFVILVLCLCANLYFHVLWYRKGDIDPKFRSLIYYNAFVILVLCLCANLYFHGVK